MSAIIDEKLKNFSSTMQSNSPDFEVIDNKLAELVSITSVLKDTINKPVLDLEMENFPSTHPDYKEITMETKCTDKPVLEHKTDYLSQKDTEAITTLLLECKEQNKFKRKRGRSTLTFGEVYTYNGSDQKPETSVIPPALVKLITKIKEDYELPDNMVPNSILINYFFKKVDSKSSPSELPKHSDDESEIQPGSSIFTYSIGESRDITFTATHHDDSYIHTATNNSLYVMSRKSQAWFKHEIIDVSSCDERFLITL